MQIETGKEVWKEVGVGSTQWATHVFLCANKCSCIGNVCSFSWAGSLNRMQVVTKCRCTAAHSLVLLSKKRGTKSESRISKLIMVYFERTVWDFYHFNTAVELLFYVFPKHLVWYCYGGLQ